MSLHDAYATHLKPHLAHLLEAFGLDVRYHRASGDRLTYDGPNGPVDVVDFVGGFGSSLLGHNHPELVALVQQALSDQIPFHAQASIRGQAGLLAERLSSLVARTTQRSYVATLCSSGAEAIEAAIKHAELEASKKNDARLADLGDRLKRLRLQIRAGRVHVEAHFLERAAEQLGVRIDSLDDLFAALTERLQALVSQAPVFVAVAGSFHGKSTGALKLTHRAEFRSPWRRLGDGTVFIPFGDSDAVRAELSAREGAYVMPRVSKDGTLSLEDARFINIAAIFVEPIQGEGGIRPLAPPFAQALRDAADRAGCPLVIDEIQSGLGRTGEFLASTPAGITGDYYVFSKALGGGLAKVSALLVDRERYVPEFGYLHTSTFAEDDLSSTVAVRTLEILTRDDDAVIARCRERGARLLERLGQLRERFPGQIREVRGRGLMIGVELEPQTHSPSPLLRVLSDQGLVGYLACGYLLRAHGVRLAPALSTGAVLRIEPSAFISDQDVTRLCTALETLCGLLQRSDVGTLIAHLSDWPASLPSPARAPAMVSPPAAPHPDAARVAFLVHFAEPSDVRAWEPALAALPDAACERFLNRTHGTLKPFILGRADMRSQQDVHAHVTFIGVPFTAQQAVASMRAGDDWALSLVKQGVDLAREQNCTVVGLGGHTSIVTDNCRDIVELDMTVTSGNSLTVAAAIEGCRLAARRARLDLQTCRMAVVGAAGNVGAVLAEIAADEVGEIVLVGHPRSERFLRPVAEAIYARAFKRAKRGIVSGVAAALADTDTARRLGIDADDAHAPTGAALFDAVTAELGDRAPVRLAVSLDALRSCNVIAACTSSAQPIIMPEHLGAGPLVICDVAVPQDVHSSVTALRSDAIVIRGGRVWAPLGQTLDVPAMRMTSSEIYGCLAETILLGFAGAECPSSYGNLTAFRVRRVRELAAVHGFAIEEREHGQRIAAT